MLKTGCCSTLEKQPSTWYGRNSCVDLWSQVQVISEPDATRGCFLESKSVCGQAAKLKYNTVGMDQGSFENCDEADCCYGITSFCML